MAASARQKRVSAIGRMGRQETHRPSGTSESADFLPRQRSCYGQGAFTDRPWSIWSAGYAYRPCLYHYSAPLKAIYKTPRSADASRRVGMDSSTIAAFECQYCQRAFLLIHGHCNAKASHRAC